MKRVIKVITTFVTLIVLATPVLAGEVHLSIAASMKDVMNELADGYARTHPAVKFIRNYGGSGALAKQIEQGAPADLFVSANPEWMTYLSQRNLMAAGEIATLAYNTLVVAGPAGTKVATMRDLVKLDRIAIGSPKSVPAGEYAMAAITKSGIEAQLAKKLVMARDVRDCLMYAERGEVDGAFVYQTDALLAKDTEILLVVPGDLYDRVSYPMAITISGAAKPEAQAFYRYLASPEAQAILKKFGFVTAPQ